jgi:hypothetical protein
MMLETMKELFGIVHVKDNEEEVPNAMCMCVGEEEVSLSQPVIAAVPPEEEEVKVKQGLYRLLLDEENIPILLECPLSQSRQRKKSCKAPLLWYRQRKRRSHSLRLPCCCPAGRKGCLVTVDNNGLDDEGPIPPLISSSPSFFFSKMQDIRLAPFSHKRGRFIG